MYFDIRNDLADSLLKGSHQLAGVPGEDRGIVLRAALDAVPEAAGLMRSYPVLFPDGESSASRLAFSCLAAAATFPLARRDQIADLGVLSAILFGVDDIADSVAGRWSERDFAALCAELPLILSGDADANPSEEPVGQIRAAWAQWCDRFHGYAGAAVHTPNLARQLELAGAAMARERAWAAGREPWPSYEDYLANGKLSFLYPTWWAAALVICGPGPADAGHWTSIEAATHLGSSCLRLANDIRTFEREKAEGKPNSVSILQATGMTTEAVVPRIAAHIDELDAAFRAELVNVPAELEDIAEGQRRSVSFSNRWYMVRDTHAYTVHDLSRDVEGHAG